MTRMESDREAYRPGQVVPISGIYTAVHKEHREPHDVVAIRGEEFPPCRVCKDQVRFFVTNRVPHMTHDFDLTGPPSRVMKHRAKAANRGSD